MWGHCSEPKHKRMVSASVFAGSRANLESFRRSASTMQPSRKPQPNCALGQSRPRPGTGDDVAVLTSGPSARRGFMVDFMGNFQKSAAAGLPVYHFKGGDDGRAALRFFAINADLLSGARADRPDASRRFGTAFPASEGSQPRMTQMGYDRFPEGEYRRCTPRDCSKSRSET
jgi:hypothetical protein